VISHKNGWSNSFEKFALGAAMPHQSPPLLGRALEELNGLDGLGTPSFASKHLRFLRPLTCPVLDAILRDCLPYRFNPTGYAEFARDCTEVADALNARGVANPHPERPTRWFVADVEAALFAHARDWSA